jgi:hypothetical protein
MRNSILALAVVIGLVVSTVPAAATGSTADHPAEPTGTAVEDVSLHGATVGDVASLGTSSTTVDSTSGDVTIQKGGSAYMGP